MRLEEIWALRESKPFDQWVVEVASAFENSSQGLQAAAKTIGVRPAELYATLQLATLDDDILTRFAEIIPPKTTWLSISSSSREGALAALEALSVKASVNEKSPWQRAEAAIETATGGSVHSRVSNLSSALIAFALKKSKDYDLLSDKQRNFLQNLARAKKLGKSLTPKQVAYLQILLNNLVTGNAIRENSPDGDQKECLEIISALKEQN